MAEPNASDYNSSHTGKEIDNAVNKTDANTADISKNDKRITEINNKIGNASISGTITQNISDLIETAATQKKAIDDNTNAINKKLEKQSNKSSVYTNSGDGTPTMVEYSVDSEQNTFAIRDGSGNVNTNTPEDTTKVVDGKKVTVLGINTYGDNNAISYKSLLNMGGAAAIVPVINNGNVEKKRNIAFFGYNSNIRKTLEFPLRKSDGNLLAKTDIDAAVKGNYSENEVLINYGYFKDNSSKLYLHQLYFAGRYYGETYLCNVKVNYYSSKKEAIASEEALISELKQTQDIILRNLPAFGLYNEGGTSPTPWPVIQINFVSNPNDKFIAYYIKNGYGNNDIEVTFQSDTVFAV